MRERDLAALKSPLQLPAVDILSNAVCFVLTLPLLGLFHVKDLRQRDVLAPGGGYHLLVRKES